MEKLSLGLLRKLRRDKGLSSQQAAKLIGKDRSTLWRLENGLSPISVKNLLKLLAGYDASVVDVFVRLPEKRVNELAVV